MKSRVARIRESENDKINKEKERKMIEAELKEAKKVYTKAIIQLDQLKGQWKIKMKDYQKAINDNRRIKEQMRSQRNSLENQFGNYGDTLVQCLINVSIFSQSEHGGANALTPLKSILTG